MPPPQHQSSTLLKQLKTSASDLRELVEQVFTIRQISEELASFDHDRPAGTVLRFMDDVKFDVVGLRREGVVSGYVRRSDLAGSVGLVGDQERPFEERLCLSESTPISRLLAPLVRFPHLFVTRRGRVRGIVTRGDLQKAPFRMWAFGLISLLEMQLLRLIRECWPGETWRDILKPGRVEKAEAIYRERCSRNEHIDLTDCLQLCDKRDIVLATPVFVRRVGVLGSDRSPGRFFKAIELLRNDLAHGQDIVSSRWPELVGLVERAERVLATCEALAGDGPA